MVTFKQQNIQNKELIANVFFGAGHWNKSTDGWFVGNCPIANDINPKTNKPWHTNGDSTASCQFKINDDGSFVVIDFTGHTENQVSDLEKALYKYAENIFTGQGWIDKRFKSDKKSKQTKKKLPSMPNYNIKKIIKTNIKNKIDDVRVFDEMTQHKAFRFCQNFEDYTEPKERNKHKIPALNKDDGKWMSPVTLKELRYKDKQIDTEGVASPYTTPLSKLAYSFCNYGTELPVVTLDIDDHSQKAKIKNHYDKITIAKDYNIHSENIVAIAKELSQSKTGLHLFILLNSKEAWQNVKAIDKNTAEAKGLFECYPNFTSQHHIISCASYVENFYEYSGKVTIDEIILEEEITQETEVLKGFDAKEVKHLAYDEIGFAKRVEFYANENFCWYIRQGKKTWMYYEDDFWSEDIGATNLKALMAKVSFKLLDEYQLATDDDTKDDILNFMKESFKGSFKNSVLDLLVGDITNFQVSNDTFTTHLGQNLINLKNGVVELHPCTKTFSLREHRKQDFFTLKNKNISYNPTADCEKWKQFLLDIYEDREDIVLYLQKACGYALAGTPTERIFIIQNGNGANGKSVFAYVMREVFGDYAFDAKKEMITYNVKGSDFNTSLYEVIRGRKRFVTINELAADDIIDDNIFKKITGGTDKINVRGMYKGELPQDECINQAVCFMQTNNLPKIKDITSATFKRIKIIEHTKTFPYEQQNQNLASELLAESDGIFFWALEGWKKWQEEGFKDTPEDIKETSKAYYTDSNFLESWCASYLEIAKGASARVNACVDSFQSYCKKNAFNTSIISRKKLTMLLAEKGIKMQHQNSQSKYDYFPNIRLLSEDEVQKELQKETFENFSGGVLDLF